MNILLVEYIAKRHTQGQVKRRALEWMRNAGLRRSAARKAKRDFLRAVPNKPFKYLGEGAKNPITIYPPPCCGCSAEAVFFCQERGVECQRFAWYVETGKGEIPDAVAEIVNDYLAKTPDEIREINRGRRRKRRGYRPTNKCASGWTQEEMEL